MAKTKITEGIETALNDMCRSKRLYGCEEVTIGFPNNGHGNEIVDFMTMDSKGILRCYEIKVSLSDLKSKAKKSWYGHYNYLAVTEDLYRKVTDWSIYIPKYIGIMVYSGHGLSLQTKAGKKGTQFLGSTYAKRRSDPLADMEDVEIQGLRRSR